MKPIRTSKSVARQHFTLAVCALVVAAFGVGSAMAAATEPKEAKLTQLFSKDLTDLPGKEGLMLLIEYPPGSSEPNTSPQRTWIYLCAGRLDRNAGQRRERSDSDTWSDLL